jgi:hypothetical protein
MDYRNQGKCRETHYSDGGLNSSVDDKRLLYAYCTIAIRKSETEQKLPRIPEASRSCHQLQRKVAAEVRVVKELPDSSLRHSGIPAFRKCKNEFYFTEGTYSMREQEGGEPQRTGIRTGMPE